MSNQIEKSSRTFWQRPEGRVGLVVSAAVLAVAGYGLFLLVPGLILLVQNTLELAGLCLALAALFYLVADAKVRAFAAYLYRAFFRALTGFVIELDPIGILKSHIAELQQKLCAMREQLGNLNGQIRRVERAIQENCELRERALGLAHAGRDDPAHVDASRLQARQAIKLEDSNQRLFAMLTQMQALFRMLKKLSDTSELVLQDMTSTVEIKQRERSSMRAAYSAYRGALAILQGQSEGRDLYDRAMEFLNDDYAKKLGEIELFMDFSDGVIKAADLENLAYDARANERLEEWERRLSNSLLGDAASSTPTLHATNAARARVKSALGGERDPLDALLEAPAARRQLPPTGER